MLGNVWEWCLDSYDENYYKNNRENPFCDLKDGDKVMRGGSWGNGAWRCRISYRRHEKPDFYASDAGFRIMYGPKL